YSMLCLNIERYFIVYIISTKYRSARDHSDSYSLRWNVEKFFRTSMQSFRLEGCQSQKLRGIAAHIVAVSLIFTAIEEVKFSK
ncbi:transposase, partial [Candidatus Dependentiae bacterium]|nr:transposase [Candidatus Dependentiae bacterium]